MAVARKVKRVTLREQVTLNYRSQLHEIEDLKAAILSQRKLINEQIRHVCTKMAELRMDMRLADDITRARIGRINGGYVGFRGFLARLRWLVTGDAA